MRNDSNASVEDVLMFILNADDKEIRLIQAAFQSRRNILNEEKKLLNMSKIYVGTKVYLNGKVSPKMLRYEYGVIEEITGEGTYRIRLDNPPSPKWRGLVGCTLDQIELP